MNEQRLIRLPEVRGLTGLCKSDIYRMEAAGDFPSRRRLSGRTVAWLLSDVMDWIQNRPTVTEEGQSR